MRREELARLIEHTNLRPDATEADIRRLAEEAKEYGFRAVVVNPSRIPLARDLVEGTGILVVTVIGFPLGATTTEAKVFEAENSIQLGADELDMVMNVGLFKDGREREFRMDISRVVSKASEYGVPVKVILETGLLTEEEIFRASRIAVEEGAAFVKTCTGFGPRGATVEDVRIMKRAVGDRAGIKAAGGIRDAKTAIAMIEAGATRIGASRSVRIVETLE